MKKFILLTAILGTAVNKAGAGPWNDGMVEGEQAAEQMWSDAGATCANIWTFRGDTDIALVDGVYEDIPGLNWQEILFNQGARAGVEAVVSKYEEGCLLNPAECVDLGDSAAEAIAGGFCLRGSKGPNDTWYGSCLRIAYSVCEGQVYFKKQIICPDKSLSNTELNDLIEECEEFIDSLVGN